MKYLIGVLFCFFILKFCFSCDSNKSQNSLKNTHNLGVFDNNYMDSVVGEYVKFVRSQPFKEYHDDKIIIAFYEENKDTFMVFNSWKYLPIAAPGMGAEDNVWFICHLDSNTIYINDDPKFPLGDHFYKSIKLNILDTIPLRTKPSIICRDEKLRNIYWTFKLTANRAKLIEKKY